VNTPNPSHNYAVVGLAYIITLGFFGVLGIQIWLDRNPDMMIGALIGAFTSGVIGYYFGTSSSSATKDATIQDLTKTAAAVATTAQATQVASDLAAAIPSTTTKVAEMAVEATTVNVDTHSKGTP
jgi:hypothetical protein